MNFDEMTEGIKGSLAGARDRTSLTVRSHPFLTLSILVLLVGSVIFWGSTGFSLQLGRSSADTSPSPTPTKKTPWLYCDYARKACVQSPPAGGVVTSDFNAPDCSSAGGGCALGKCRRWEGEGRKLSDWKPLESPAGLPACEPLSEWSGEVLPGYDKPYFLEGAALPPGVTTPGWYTPTPRKPPPVDYPNCLHIEPYGGMPEEIFSNPIPKIGVNTPAKMQWFIVNNCPWEVHMVFLTTGSAKAGNWWGDRVALSQAKWEALADEDTAPARDFKSCWNSGALQRPETCGKLITITYNLNAFTCGSVGLQLDWWHRVNNNSSGSGNNLSDSYCDPADKWQERGCSEQTFRGQGMIGAMSWGQDCTGGPLERSPVEGGVGSPSPFPTGGSPVPTSSGGPAPTYSYTPQPSYIYSPAPTGGSTYTPQPSFTTTPACKDSDDDGYCDEVECPGLTNCPDTDGDGTPDYLDTDSDNDGIPDRTDCNRVVAGPCNGGAGQVQTGPGEATVLALIVSALVSLLYVTYTHSPLGLKREVEDISKDQGPMNFKS